MIELPRCRFITGLASLLAAPAIVKASSIMPVRGWQISDRVPVMLSEAEYWYLAPSPDLTEAAIEGMLIQMHSFNETCRKLNVTNIPPEKFYVSYGQ